MSSISERAITACLAMSLLLGGCGTAVPLIEGKDNYATARFAKSIAANVHCQLRRAVWQAYDEHGPEWFKDWAAKVVLDLTVTENTAVSPSTLITQPLSPAPNVFNLGLGGGLSSTATRELKFGWFLSFPELIRDEQKRRNFYGPDKVPPCEVSGPEPVYGDLRIQESLNSGVLVASINGLSSPVYKIGGPLDLIEHNVTFEVEITGNVNPSVVLTQVTFNNGGPILSGRRDRKDNLIITMGPGQLDNSRKPQLVPSLAVENSSLAAQIGQAVSNAVRLPR